MASVSIQASGAHANVATTYRGETPILTGWSGGCVPLDLQAKGAAVDVSTYNTLRLDLMVSAMSCKDGYENGRPDAASLFVVIEEASAAAGPWRIRKACQPMKDIGSQRAVLSGFDNFVRASYYIARPSMPDTIKGQVAITWALTGEAI